MQNEYMDDEVLIKDVLQTIVTDMCEARDIDEDKIPYLLRDLALDIEEEQSKYVKITRLPEDDFE